MNCFDDSFSAYNNMPARHAGSDGAVEQQPQPPERPLTCTHGTTLGMCELCPPPAHGVPEQLSPASARKFLDAFTKHNSGWDRDVDGKHFSTEELMEAFASHQLQQATTRIKALEQMYTDQKECRMRREADLEQAQQRIVELEKERDEARKYVVCSYCGDKQPKIEPFDRETYADQILVHLPDCPTHPANKWFVAEAECDSLKARLQQLEGALREYGKHDTGCPCIFDLTLCTCGLAALLTPPAAGEEG